MKVLVLGGSYFIGKHIVQSLCDTERFDAKVFILNRGTRAIDDSGTTLLKGDRLKPESLAMLREHTFDVIVDVSAETSDFISNTLPALKGSAGAKYIYISSAAVYKRQPEMHTPCREDDPIGGDPVWGTYGQEKSACEELLRQADFQLYCLRPPYVYGPGNSSEREQFIWARLVKGLPVLTPDNEATVIQFVSVFDLCQAILTIAADSSGSKVPQGSYNLGENRYYSFKDYIGILASVANTEAHLDFVDRERHANARDYFPFRDSSMTLAVSKAEHAFGRARSLAAGMAPTFAWFNSQDRIRYNPTEAELMLRNNG